MEVLRVYRAAEYCEKNFHMTNISRVGGKKKTKQNTKKQNKKPSQNPLQICFKVFISFNKASLRS